MFAPLAADELTVARANPVLQGDDAAAAGRKRERIGALWEEAQPLGGTLGERYLTAARGISQPVDGWPVRKICPAVVP